MIEVKKSNNRLGKLLSIGILALIIVSIVAALLITASPVWDEPDSPEEYTLTVKADGSGTVYVSPPGKTVDRNSSKGWSYREETEVTITANSSSGASFDKWTDGKGEFKGRYEQTTVPMNSDKTRKAFFSEEAEKTTLIVKAVEKGNETNIIENAGLDVGGQMDLSVPEGDGGQLEEEVEPGDYHVNPDHLAGEFVYVETVPALSFHVPKGKTKTVKLLYKEESSPDDLDDDDDPEPDPGFEIDAPDITINATPKWGGWEGSTTAPITVSSLHGFNDEVTVSVESDLHWQEIEGGWTVGWGVTGFLSSTNIYPDGSTTMTVEFGSFWKDPDEESKSLPNYAILTISADGGGIHHEEDVRVYLRGSWFS